MRVREHHQCRSQGACKPKASAMSSKRCDQRAKILRDCNGVGRVDDHVMPPAWHVHQVAWLLHKLNGRQAALLQNPRVHAVKPVAALQRERESVCVCVSVSVYV